MSLGVALLQLGLLGLSLDLGAGARSEVRGGQAPAVAGGEPQAGMAAELTPVLGLRLQSRRSTTELRYRLRVFYRYPNPLELDRPLFFHQADVSEQLRLSRRATWDTRVEAGIGELDYTASTIAFQPIAAASLTDVVVMRSLYASSSMALELDRRQHLRLGPELSHIGPLNEDDAAFPTQTRVGVDATHEYTASRRSTVQSSLSADRYAFSSGERVVTLRAVAGLEHRLSRVSELTLFAGALYGTQIEPEYDVTVTPEVGAELGSLLWVQGEDRLRGQVGVGVVGFVDPLLAQVEPRLGITASSDLALSSRFRFGALGSFYTVPTAEPRTLTSVEPGVATAALDETFVAFATPVQYQASRNMLFEVGTRGTLRGPHWRAEDFGLGRLELWVYVAAIVQFGTDREGGGWVL